MSCVRVQDALEVSQHVHYNLSNLLYAATYNLQADFTFETRELRTWGPIENGLVMNGIADHFAEITMDRVVIIDTLDGSVVVSTDIQGFTSQASAMAAQDDIDNERIVFDNRLGPYTGAARDFRVASTGANHFCVFDRLTYLRSIDCCYRKRPRALHPWRHRRSCLPCAAYYWLLCMLPCLLQEQSLQVRA